MVAGLTTEIPERLPGEILLVEDTPFGKVGPQNLPRLFEGLEMSEPLDNLSRFDEIEFTL